MKLTSAQSERAAGVLIGTAVGDALGVPYEFDGIVLPDDEPARMLGGGLGDFAPGEWSDDTAMSVAIAEVVATGADLTTDSALDAVAENFLAWFASNPPDVGNQTRAVLGATRSRLAADAGARPGAVMRAESRRYADARSHSAGNGALMRTAPVALAHLDDRDRLAKAARVVASLTHADPLAGDSCVLWCEAIRVAVLDGRLDLTAGLDLLPSEHADDWSARLQSAISDHPKTFSPNGFTVTALQAAASAIHHTPGLPDDPAHFQESLHTAIRIGNDTDTVAAIAGGLLGALWGARVIPGQWINNVRGWPVREGEATDGRKLVTLI